MRSKLKNILFYFLMLGILAGCKKDAGKHCPIIDDGVTQWVDLSPVKNIKEIMDTLAKYPELQVYRAQLTWGVYDPTNYFASVSCNIYYKGVLIFNKSYGIDAINVLPTYYSEPLPLKINELSVIPAINREKAHSIALKASSFPSCPASTLGIMNFSADSTPLYKLVWRVRGPEYGYPIVFLDAQTGEVYSVFDGRMS